MSLLNSQYDQIMRHYDELREENRRTEEARAREVRRQIPEIAALERKAASLSAAYARSKILGNPEDDTDYEAELARIARKRVSYLTAAGYPADYLDPVWHCPICHDTGYTDGQKCICFRRAEINLLYRQYDLDEILAKENFACFDFDCYSDGEPDPRTGKTPRETAQEAYAAARMIAARIGDAGNNLFLHGNPGTGKTFLAHCIMKEALDHACAALSFSAQDFFDLLADAAFQRNAEAPVYVDLIRKSPLLVIDDLGTELTNELTSTALFQMLNERLTAKRSTILSTNLTLKEFDARYSGRTTSRVLSEFLVLEMTGEDIRLKKRKQLMEAL